MFKPLLAFCLYFPLCAVSSRPKNAVLSEVQSLTLRGHGAKTSHRRDAAIPQLKCISSRDICKLYEIDVMQCTNQGSSYGDEDIEWSCTATLPEELKLGGTDVICEGYSSPDDPYVLRGSCGVEYRLILTAKGEARYPGSASTRNGFFSLDNGKTDWSAWLFAVVFIAILAWILYSACFSNDNRRQPRAGIGRGGGWGEGGGGGGGGGWNPGWGRGNDPPPLYPGKKPHSSQAQAWTPGFWSGVLGGAVAGYVAGGRNRSDDRRSYSTNWAPASFSSPSSGGSARYESTGFGSTRRR